MFKLYKPTNGEAAAYAKVYAAKLLPLINAYLGGKVLDVMVKNRGVVHLAVDTKSLTRRFLEKLSDQNWLEKFLLMNPSQQVSFIKYLESLRYPNELIFKRLLAGTFDKYNLTRGGYFDHFNEIIYDIFVNGIYDGDGTFDKHNFIQNTGLKICPYCGMEYIRPTNKSKKQIDHFFPKRKYPFLALCYYNLIPSCDICNESPNKGAKDPIEKVFDGKNIMHPYCFKEPKVRFHLAFNGIDMYDASNFKIKVGFSEAKYRDGYVDFFDVIDRYEIHNEEAAQDYRRLMDIMTLPFYDRMGMVEVRKRLFAYGVGKDNPQNQLFYKMRNDIFKQILGKRIVGDYYTKYSGDGTERLK